MTKERQILGESGEEAAFEFLRKKRYRILERNYKTPLGEIDIIAQDKDCLVFIEVKSLSNTSYILPQEMVNKRKQEQIIRVALSYLKAKGLRNADCRFDCVAVVFSLGKEPEIELIKDAFQSDDRYLY
ncbi:YraN family protein [bacterium]|nr:YraN family protein [bacterium]MCG2676594.1 YraN family protein [bacterium]